MEKQDRARTSPPNRVIIELCFSYAEFVPFFALYSLICIYYVEFFILMIDVIRATHRNVLSCLQRLNSPSIIDGQSLQQELPNAVSGRDTCESSQ